MKYQTPRGTHDILPIEKAGEEEFNIARWHHVESIFRDVSKLYGYREIRTPMFEDKDLFIRSSGETSDIVSKEMYDFEDKGGREIALRPEGTAPVMRAYLEHHLGLANQPTRLCYQCQAFRYGRPGRGRYRQLHQFGYELIGSASPNADAEIIEVTVNLFRAVGLTGLKVLVNSIGRAETRARYTQVILDHVSGWLKDQTEEERAKALKNPLRLLDTKNPGLRACLEGLPTILEHLEDESKAHFEKVQAALGESGVEYVVDSSIVRGLDYYTDTVFEVVGEALGDQISLCGGGRYDNLIAQLGGPETPSVGVGIGIERMLITMQQSGIAAPETGIDAFVVAATESAISSAKSLAHELRKDGFSVQLDPDFRAMKGQLKLADRVGAKFALILGDDELSSNVVSVKNLKSFTQESVARSEVAAALRK